MTLGDGSNLVEAVIDRVGAHTVCDVLELGQILIDLPGIDWNVRTERTLAPAKRRVRHTIKLLT